MSKHVDFMPQPAHEDASTAPCKPTVPFQDPPDAVPDHRGDEEALRIVQQVFLLPKQEVARIVVFAGVDHQVGCSRICASVGKVLARYAKRPVLLVDANFRSPSLSNLFGESPSQGLTEALLSGASLTTYASPVRQDNLWLISTGTVTANSASLLTPEYLRGKLTDLLDDFDFVLIDTPPLTRYSDAAAVGRLANGLVMILEADSTRREAAVAAADNLRSLEVRILAAVLNKRSFPIPNKIYGRI